MPDLDLLEIQTLTVGPFAVNCYIIVDRAGGEALIIDPGDEVERILNAAHGLDVRAILLTHGHLDHTGGVEDVKRRLKTPIFLHEEEIDLYRSLPNQGLMFGLAFNTPPEPDRLLKEGDEVKAGSITLKVLHTPGHSPGHLTLYMPGHAFVGDCLFSGSIGRTDLPGGDYDTLMESLGEKIMTLPDETIVHSGHGPETTIGEECRSNPFLTHGR